MVASSLHLRVVMLKIADAQPHQTVDMTSASHAYDRWGTVTRKGRCCVLAAGAADDKNRSSASQFWNLPGFGDAIAVAHMPEDGELLRRFRAGDREAFTAIYRAHQAAVFRFARMMTGDPMKAAEVTQDVFVWLIHHPGDFDPERGGLSGFLVGVARYLLKRRYREERRWAPLEEIAIGADFQRKQP